MLALALALAVLALSSSSVSITCCSLGGARLGMELRRRWLGKATNGTLVRGWCEDEGRERALAERDAKNGRLGAMGLWVGHTCLLHESEHPGA